MWYQKDYWYPLSVFWPCHSLTGAPLVIGFRIAVRPSEVLWRFCASHQLHSIPSLWYGRWDWILAGQNWQEFEREENEGTEDLMSASLRRMEMMLEDEEEEEEEEGIKELSVFQGECWLWTSRGTSTSHRTACRCWHLLWVLQNNTWLEIRKWLELHVFCAEVVDRSYKIFTSCII